MCSGTDAYMLWDYGTSVPTCSRVSPARRFIADLRILLGHCQANSRYQRTLRKRQLVAKRVRCPLRSDARGQSHGQSPSSPGYPGRGELVPRPGFCKILAWCPAKMLKVGCSCLRGCVRSMGEGVRLQCLRVGRRARFPPALGQPAQLRL